MGRFQVSNMCHRKPSIILILKLCSFVAVNKRQFLDAALFKEGYTTGEFHRRLFASASGTTGKFLAK